MLTMKPYVILIILVVLALLPAENVDMFPITGSSPKEADLVNEMVDLVKLMITTTTREATLMTPTTSTTTEKTPSTPQPELSTPLGKLKLYTLSDRRDDQRQQGGFLSLGQLSSGSGVLIVIVLVIVCMRRRKK